MTGQGSETRIDISPGRRSRDGMCRIPGGRFLMGSEDFYPEERPVHEVEVAGFWMDRHQVTNAEFRKFVKETGYVTVAERPLDPADYPDADPDLLVPGSLVFQKTSGPVDLNDYRNWWAYLPGAHWRRPGGPGTTFHGRGNHPVVHIAWEDAEAYARWVGKDLPTEAEWEFAARGGLEGATFTWGDEHFPDGKAMANSWQGEFPWQNLQVDGFEGTSPVGSFPRQRIRLARHGGQRLGMDLRLVHPNVIPTRQSMPVVSPPTPGSPHRSRATTRANPVSTSPAG